MLTFGLNETINNQLAMTNSNRWYGHVLREVRNILRDGVERRLKRALKKHVEEEMI